MANMWVESVKHCGSNMGRFDGRDRPGQFWPYAGTVVVLDFVVWIVAVNAAMNRVTLSTNAVGRSVSPATNGSDIFSSLLLVMAALALITILLLAASVVRRLHDRGSSGWWGLLPVPFLFLGLLGMTVFRSGAAGAGTSSLFLLLSLNNIAYMVSIVVLIVMLAWSSEPRDNRYGPASVRPA